MCHQTDRGSGALPILLLFIHAIVLSPSADTCFSLLLLVNSQFSSCQLVDKWDFTLSPAAVARLFKGQGCTLTLTNARALLGKANEIPAEGHRIIKLGGERLRQGRWPFNHVS